MAGMSPYATNVYNVTTPRIDYSDTSAPTTFTYHGVSIVVAGNIIGRITSWQPSGAYTREGVHIYELQKDTWGRPVDYVPGRSTGYTLTFVRAEVWGQETEVTFGFNTVFNDLSDQTRPFVIQEYIFKGQELYRVWQYSGCWFQDKNFEAMTADGDGVLRCNGTVAYVSRIRTQ